MQICQNCGSECPEGNQAAMPCCGRRQGSGKQDISRRCADGDRRTRAEQHRLGWHAADLRHPTMTVGRRPPPGVTRNSVFGDNGWVEHFPESSSLRIVGDVSDAQWIAGSIGRGNRVAALIPPIFAEYCRILHPASLAGAPVRWSSVAESNGARMHPLVQFPNIAGTWQPEPDGHVWSDAPDEDCVPVDIGAALAPLLARHTSDPSQCNLACWDGFFSEMGLVKLTRARLSLFGRRYLVLRGRIQDMTVPLDPLASVTANMAWPDAREWFVHADLDFPCTYIGGSRSCIAELMAHPDLETLPAHPDDPIDYLSDQVNPLPVIRPRGRSQVEAGPRVR